ncbi:MAG: flavocytochrome c [Solobacterium sp.]|nr:flavocytochrome c [Solobacterium sp.]
MKKAWKILAAISMSLALGACSGGSTSSAGSTAPEEPASEASTSRFKAGTYEGEEAGFGGENSPIHVSVTLSDDAIESIEYTADAETPTVGGAALPQLVEAVLAAQSTQIDGVSGATFTSNGFFTAVNEALESAGVDPASLEPIKTETAIEDIEKTVDVVVAGAGGAGMTAAITAAQNGKSVIILEKASVPGGNSSYATGGMNAANTHYQAEQNIEDSAELFFEDTMEGGHQINNPDLVHTLADNSSAAIDWLDSIGAPLSDVGQAGGASAARQHRPVNDEGKVIAVGTFLVEHLSSTCAEMGIEIMTNTKVDEVLMEDGKAVGLHAIGKDGQNVVIHANSVVVTTGGFGSNPDLIVKYRPDLEGYVSTNAPSITGDAIEFMTAAGADFVDLDQIQIHPTVVQKDGALISESLRGDGAILLNKEGKRFCNEILTRDVVSAHVNEQPDSYAWLLADQNMADKSAVIEKYVSKGYMIKCDTVADLAKLIGCDEATLQETLNTWSADCTKVDEYKYGVNDSQFERVGKDEMKTDMTVAPYYAVQISPGIHHCMGGVKINTNAEVVGTNGEVIPNLFAAGEVTGGVHGGNRLGGNAVADFVVFGRIAGTNASK